MNKNYAYRWITGLSGRCLFVVAASALLGQANAQLNVAAVNTAYTVNFDGTVAGVSNGAWAGTGFQPIPTGGRLDSDAWAVTGWSNGSLGFGGTRITANTDYRRGTTAPGNGAVAVAGFWSFGGVGITGRALGIQPATSDWAPGTLTLRVQNTTGSTLTAFDVAYNVFYRNDQASSSSFNLQYSDDNVTYTNVPSQDLTSPAAASGPAWVANARSTTINGVYVPNGQYFYVRWRGADVSVSGARDEFALDDISVTGRTFTLVRLTSSTSSVIESVGTTQITASIINPHPTNPTTVDLVLTSGPAARINGYTSQTLNFPGGSIANQSVTVTVTDNGACDGSAVEVFDLQNIAGGLGTPAIGTPSSHTLTITDDETSAMSWAQAFDGGVGDTWAILAGAGNISSNSGAADTPANQRILSPTQSWQVQNSIATLDLAAVDIEDWSSITLQARFSSTSTSPTNGADGNDSIKFYVDLDGAGFPATADVAINGNSNGRWGYGSGTVVATTTAGTPVNYTSNLPGIIITTVQITIPNGTNTVALRVIGRNNVTSEIWNLDNITLTGTLCSPVYYSRANGSETTPTWSTSRTGVPAPSAVTFNKNKTMVVQNTHTVTTTSNVNLALRNMTVETGGALSFAGLSALTLHGPTFRVDGTLTATDDNFSLIHSSLTTISGTTSAIGVNDLTCDGGGVLVTTNVLQIRGTLLLNNGNFNANNKEVQLISTATGTARLGPVAPTASYTSRLRIERYIPAGVTDWRLIANPMLNRTISDWTDDFFTAGFPGSAYPNFYDDDNNLWPSIRMYDETDPGLTDDDGLIGVSGSTEPLTVGKGFAAWSGTTYATTTAFVIDMRGPPTVASTPFSIPMSYTNSPATAAVDGLNLVGNPLPSPIDFGSLSLGPDVDNAYYIYDPGSGTNAAWDEVTQIGTGGTNGNIQSSQAFWLHCTGASNAVTVLESAKVLEPINGGIFSLQQDTRAMIRMRIAPAGEPVSDETVVHFIAGSPEYGAGDMAKLSFGENDNARISTHAVSGEDLVINAMGQIAQGDIPVRVRIPVAGDHTITFNNVGNVTGRACVVFEDLVNGTLTQVLEGASYAFYSDLTEDVDAARFVLHVSAPLSSEVHDATCALTNDGAVTVEGAGSGPWNYTLTDVFGNVLAFATDMTTSHIFNALAPGNYQVHVQGSASCGELVHDVQIAAPSLIDVEATTAPATCAAAADGSAALQVLGGTAPYTITWSNGSTGTDLSMATPGEYSATIVDANGCTAEMNGVQVTAGAGHTANFSIGTEAPMPGEVISFFNESTYGLEYLWNMGDGTVLTETEFDHTYTDAGVYTVTLTATDGVCSATHTMNVQVGLSTGVEEHDLSGLNAWLEGSAVTIQWQVEGASTLSAQLIDASGRTVLERSVKGAMGRFSIPVNSLSAGAYTVQLKAGDALRAVPIILAR